MRILFVIHQFYPEFNSGTERIAYQLAKAAQASGHFVRVLTTKLFELESSGWTLDKRTGLYEGMYEDIPVTAIMRSDLNELTDYSLDAEPGISRRISRLLDRDSYDACHIMHLMRTASIVKAVRDKAIPYVITLTDFHMQCYRGNLITRDGDMCYGAKGGQQCARDCVEYPWQASKLLARARAGSDILASANRIVCPSRYTSQYFRREFPTLLFTEIGHGVDIALSSSTPISMDKAASDSDYVVFGYLGSVIHDKGVDLLISGFRQVSATSARLKICGGFFGIDEYEEEILQLIDGDPRIEILPPVKHENIRSFLQSLDVICLPSRVPESYSLVLHEAQFLGIPAIVSPLGAPMQHILDYGSGEVIASNDVENWVSVVERIVENPSQITEWSGNITAPRRVEEEAASYLKIYEELSRRCSADRDGHFALMNARRLPKRRLASRVIRRLWPYLQIYGLLRQFLYLLDLYTALKARIVGAVCLARVNSVVQAENHETSNYDDYYRCTLPDIRQVSRLVDNARNGNYSTRFEIWIDASHTDRLSETLQSIAAQGYPNLRVCIFDPTRHAAGQVKSLVQSLPIEERDIYEILHDFGEPVKITRSTYLVFMDAAEILGPLTLCLMAEYMRENPKADLIYSDHDRIIDAGIHTDPHFLPDWSPEYHLARDYIGGVFFVRDSEYLQSCLQDVKPFSGLAWRYELLLRLTDHTIQVEHYPSVLWSDSWCSDHQLKQRKHIEATRVAAATLTRREYSASIDESYVGIDHKINWHLEQQPKVSIIIPTTGDMKLLGPCLESIREKTTYKNYELIILINGGGQFPEGIAYAESLGLNTIVDSDPFNWSRLNNRGAELANGELLLFLNDDVEVIEDNWLLEMIMIANRADIGVVGSMLLYPTGQIQHAGLVLIDHGGGALHSFIGMDPNDSIYNNLHAYTREVMAVTGACLMVRRTIFQDLNGFDEGFAISGNDIDFCLRTIGVGYRNVWASHSKLIHKESVTRGKKEISYRDEQNIWRRWKEVFLAGDPYYNLNFSNEAANYEFREFE